MKLSNYCEIYKADVSPRLSTVNNALSGMLNHAVRFYGLPVNPMTKAGKIGSAKANGMNFWTKDEYLKFSEEVMDKPASFAIFELLYWCGIREGEALALMPEDFDFEKNPLKINKSYQRILSTSAVVQILPMCSTSL